MRFYFSYFYLTVVLLNPCQLIEARQIECAGVKALPLTPDLQHRLNNSVYWTKKYQNTRTPSKITYPFGFVHEENLVCSILKFIDNTSFVESYISVPGCSDDFEHDSNDCIVFQRIFFNMDDEKAIFEYKNPFPNAVLRRVSKTAFEETERNYSSSEIFKFALIYVAERNKYRIYQTCDKMHTWVQIKHNTLRKLLSLGAKAETDDNHKDIKIQHGLDQLDQVILDKLREKKIWTNYFDIKDRMGLEHFEHHYFEIVDAIHFNEKYLNL